MRTKLLAYLLAWLVMVLCASPAHASVYYLAQNVTAVQTTPSLIAQPTLQAPGQPPGLQAFQITVTGTGSVSCTVQIVGTNLVPADGSTPQWVNYGLTFTASGTNTATYGAQGNTPFSYYGAIVTAISGTGAKCTVTVSA